MSRLCLEKEFAVSDGTKLFYRHWPAAGETDFGTGGESVPGAEEEAAPVTKKAGAKGSGTKKGGKKTTRPKGAVVMFHRGHEHSGRMVHIVEELGLGDFAFFAWDARGHGRSPGERGDSPSFAVSVRDVDDFVRHVGARYGFEPDQVVVLAQSVGAVLAATWAHDYAPPVRAMILASPAFSVKLYVPFARQGIKLFAKLRGNFFVNSYVKAKFLTHDPERIASFDSDPLITRAISARILTGLYDNAERVVADAGAMTIPTMLLISGNDWVVRAHPQHAFFNRLPCPENERHVLPGFYHDTLGERNREQAFGKIRDFIGKIFAMPPYRPDLSNSDKEGPSARAAKWLESPLPPCSPKALAFAGARAAIACFGNFSDGIRLGRETGFDSGSTLDYVYRNRAGGTNALGRFMDRQYLDSPGWTGIRARKVLVEELIALGAEKLREAGQPVRLLDIAAGHGRYILDALAALPEWEHAVLRDYSPLNVTAGAKAIAERGLADRAEFIQGDAFDEESLAAVSPRPTMAVVSGLYELFPVNASVKASLAGLARAVPEGGYLVYTNQPWHPQLEFIARVLTSHRGGDAWVMRCRSQAEMDGMVEAAGFVKVAQRCDENAIFTVGLARRVL